MFNKTLAFAVLASVAAVGAAEARDQIKIVGSSTVYPFSTVVAENFGKGTGFKTPVIESTGSGGGFKLFCAGVGADYPDITNASRRMKKSEWDACRKNGVADVVELRIGYDGITLANAKKGPDFNLTTVQIYKALAKNVPVNGKFVANPYKKWSDVDKSLPDNKIEVLGPPPTSGTRDAFTEMVMEVGCKATPEGKALTDDAQIKANCMTLREDGAYVDAGENDNLIVQKLEANPKALGIFGFSYLEENQDKVKGAKIGGQVPTFETISSGAYPVSRPLQFYVKKAHVGVIPGIAEYVQEFFSEKEIGPEGSLADKGLIPMGNAERAVWQDKAKQLKTITEADL